MNRIIKPFLIREDIDFFEIDKIKIALPEGERLIMPFIGAGTVFLNTDYPSYLLGDVDAEIVNVFRMAAEYKEEFIYRAKQFSGHIVEHVSMYEHYKGVFNRNSLKDIEEEQFLERACIYLYLNYHSINGAHYYNSNKMFDLPYGNKVDVYFPEKELKDFIAKVRRCNVEFLIADYKETLEFAEKGDVVFASPPLLPMDGSYFENSRNFTWSDHFKLCNIYAELKAKNIPMRIYNKNVEKNRKENTKLRFID